MTVVWFWIGVVAATSVYTFVSLVSDARIYSKPDVSYGERFGGSTRGWSAAIGFLALGDFIGTSAVYQTHAHLLDWELAPLLYRWPLILIDLLMLVVVSLLLSLPTALVLSRIRIPWLLVGIVLFLLGVWHGANSPVRPP